MKLFIKGPIQQSFGSPYGGKFSSRRLNLVARCARVELNHNAAIDQGNIYID